MSDEFRKKAEEIVGEMTVSEVAGQLKYNAPAIDRLGIPAYNWWNEGLHGVARSGTATVFPQAIGLAAMFDRDMLKRIAEVISTEARAKYNENRKNGDRGIYKGITLWSPNINIFRDPRWGRGQETYGEDPYLTGELGVSFIKGLQGDGKYMKTAACAKHFVAHSGPESLRHGFNAVVSEKDLAETYMPAFEKAVKVGKVEAVMGAYNRTNGEPCCGSKSLIEDKLRKEWGFEGHFVSDCWAVNDFHKHHMVTDTPEESAAMALNAGCDLNCGSCYESIETALDKGLITEERMREAAERIFTTRAKLGMIADSTEYDSLNQLDVDTAENKKLSYEASCRSLVMLKNDGILPLKNVKNIAVIGPTANSQAVLEGNYNGVASEYVTNLEGITRFVNEINRTVAEDGMDESDRAASVGQMDSATRQNMRVFYSMGSHLYKDKIYAFEENDDLVSEAVSIANCSDVVILSVGLDTTIEGEEGDTGNAFAAGDKVDLFLPDSQRRLIRKLAETGKPIVLVNNTGSPMDLTEEENYCSAIIQCWYSGEYGGLALADTLFGKNCPSGKLPITFYKNGSLPEFTDYSMKGRTYRYLDDEPEFPFGYGLSYTTFKYDGLDIRESEKITCSVDITNTGDIDAEEITEVYVAQNVVEKGENDKNGEYLGRMEIDNQPKYKLVGFARTFVKAGETVRVSIDVDKNELMTVLSDGSRALLRGKYDIYVGGSQPDAVSERLLGAAPLSATVEL
ncbi:MAG: glycoside hydrolase family 3 C-terminal domain-containing protein [Eubacterium sp.]|nr:glycoside hydrolase family 3 C-terminal domain-containing protein [Eubacterium sp.]